jgi:3-oxoacyl-[acyl-carrier-protein] synthase-3
MHTDSELLLEAGVNTGFEAFELLLKELDWSREEIASTVCHQVGTVHRRRMLERLGMPEANDFSTFAELGNTGSVALPTAFGMALEHSFFSSPSKIALLGIGSGLNSVMLGLAMKDVPCKSE